MSDRTKSSVRTDSRGGDDDAPGGSTPGGATPVTSTQSIPGADTARTQGSGGPASGAQPAVSPNPVPPIPATGTGPVASATGAAAAPGAPDATGSVASRIRGRAGKGGRGPRRARLQLRHVDIWSAFKISFVLSIAMFFIWMVAVGVLYGVLSALGVFDTLNDLFGQLSTASGSELGGDVVTPGLVFGGAAVIGAINIVLMTALCTVGTFIYNLCSDLVGGLELTLSERD
jgi:hypothetical protein